MILLTGGSGQLGRELQKLGNYWAPSRAELDITDRDSVAVALTSRRPELIVHAAAYTRTLAADNDAAEAVKCWRTNVVGTKNLLAYAECPVIYVSTEAAIHPYSFYILTKMQAELEVAQHRPGYTVVRTSFREDPFEYRFACTDMWTIGDYVAKIAGLLHDLVTTRPVQNRVVWLGTGAKTVYQLATRSRPDVKPIMRSEVRECRLPSLEELLDI